MANVYLASSFSLTNRVERVYEHLIGDGHVVPDVWWRNSRLADEHEKAGTDEYYELPAVKGMAERHFTIIESCDAFVLVTPPDRTRKFNGASIEFGYAHGNDVPVYVLGKIDRSAMFVPMEGRYDDVNRLSRHITPDVVDEDG